MKRCPRCGNTYTDDNLVYCLQDGSSLMQDGSIDEEPETVVRTFDGSDILDNEIDPGAKSESAQKVSGFWLGLIVVSIAALLSLVGAIAYFGVQYSGKSQPIVVAVEKDHEVEINDLLSKWVESAQQRRIEPYMALYGDHINYYTKRRATKDAVRSDKLAAFSKFTSIKITLTNISVKTTNERDFAFVEFDKGWDFSDGKRKSIGKVRGALELELRSGNWLIVSEKDLKVYYVNR